MRKGNAPYTPSPWGAKDTRILLNWLSTRVDVFGNVAEGCEYERRLILPRMRLARSLGFMVVSGAYIVPPPSTKGAAARGKPRKRTAA
jgi:hypothetical protein